MTWSLTSMNRKFSSHNCSTWIIDTYKSQKCGTAVVVSSESTSDTNLKLPFVNTHFIISKPKTSKALERNSATPDSYNFSYIHSSSFIAKLYSRIEHSYHGLFHQIKVHLIKHGAPRHEEDRKGMITWLMRAAERETSSMSLPSRMSSSLTFSERKMVTPSSMSTFRTWGWSKDRATNQ